MFNFFKNILKKTEPEEKALIVPAKINGVSFKDYCYKVMNNQWRESDNIDEFEQMLFMLTEINCQSRKENAEIFYNTIISMGVEI